MKITATKRNALPASAFAGPNRSYPVPDKAHAANAKARASQAVNAGRMSGAVEAKIDAKANRVLARPKATAAAAPKKVPFKTSPAAAKAVPFAPPPAAFPMDAAHAANAEKRGK